MRSSSAKTAEIEFFVQYRISPQMLKVTRFLSVSSVINAKNEEVPVIQIWNRLMNFGIRSGYPVPGMNHYSLLLLLLLLSISSVRVERTHPRTSLSDECGRVQKKGDQQQHRLTVRD